jgi:lysophospholipase L1-like esterase
MVLFIVFTIYAYSQPLQIKEPVRFLALGDSYTVGQSVPSASSWPAQLTDSLKSRGYEIGQLSIIATTGWRTDNLKNALLTLQPENDYNLVSLLIGVNDQYQGVSVDLYPAHFEELLNMAIEYAGGDTSSVFILSIPDYAYTPFGQDMNAGRISSDIDQYNAINSAIARDYGVAYFDITSISREGLARPELVAADGLHPSGLMYSLWVSYILAAVVGGPAVSSYYADPGLSLVSDITSFPDPVNDQLHFYSGNTGMDNLEIRIFTSSGKMVNVTRLSPKHDTHVVLNVAFLCPGIYFYEIISDRKLLTNGKFVKN